MSGLVRLEPRLHLRHRLLGSHPVLGLVDHLDETHRDVASAAAVLAAGERLPHVGGVVEDLAADERVEHRALHLTHDRVGLLEPEVALGLVGHEVVVKLASEQVDREPRRHADAKHDQRQREHSELGPVREHQVERPQVGETQPRNTRVDTDVQGVGGGRYPRGRPAPTTRRRRVQALPRRVAAPPVQVVGGQDQQALEERGDQADDHRLREDRHELARSARHQQHREEGRTGGADGGDDRPQHLLGALHHRLAKRFPRLDAAVDVLEHDDRVVDEHAGDQQHADQRHRVDGEVEERKEDQGGQEAERDGHDREQRIAEADREPQKGPDQEDSDEQVVREHAHPRADPAGGIPGRVDLDPLGHHRSIALREGVDALRHGQELRALLLGDGQYERGVPVVAPVEAPLLDALLDRGQVSQPHVAGARNLDDDGV